MSTLAKCELISCEEVVADDPVMLRLLDMACTVARHKTAVLITGETGTGKEVVARLIHRYSDRSTRPWVDLNCATLPEHLVESELFGYEKGAFSGADTAKPGLFELANGGTLFLDEIGEIEPRVQVKLLRVLDSVPYFRLGGRTKVTVDVRLIAATNRDLESAVQSGTFRRDLYHRISEFHLAVPPLRERPDDIAALAKHFLEQGHPGKVFTAEALAVLSRLDWPGNVRELRSLVNATGMLMPHSDISADDINRYLSHTSSIASRARMSEPEQQTTVAAMERQMIVRALESTGGNQSLAAQQLGIPRRTFCRKLKVHNIVQRSGKDADQTVLRSAGNRRAELHVPIVLTTSGGRRSVVEACDISAGGIGLSGIDFPLATGAAVTLAFRLPTHAQRIDAQAQVAWSRPDGASGLKFTNLSPAAAEIIRIWVTGEAQRFNPAADRIAPAPETPGDHVLRL